MAPQAAEPRPQVAEEARPARFAPSAGTTPTPTSNSGDPGRTRRPRTGGMSPVEEDELSIPTFLRNSNGYKKK